MKERLRFVISGGGTGGHIYPAVAIVEAIRKFLPEAQFLFIGATGKMEMEKIPALGYDVIGIPIAGVQRSLNPKSILRNLMLPIKLLYSFVKVFRILYTYKPHVAIGTGGYASGPTIKMAQWMGIPSFIQEQNALPGYTNRILGANAKCAFVSFEETKKFFSSVETMYTGNAIREDFADKVVTRVEAAKYFNLNPSQPTVFVTGGSLGAKAINEGIRVGLDELAKEGIQVVWQTGKSHYQQYKTLETDKIKIFDFISDMQMAYGVADIIVTRAGGALFEMFVIGKPIIVLPSPYVAEDHQTKNAEALVEKKAAILITDKESNKSLVPTIIQLMKNESQKLAMSQAIKSLAKPYAATEIAKRILSSLQDRI